MFVLVVLAAVGLSGIAALTKTEYERWDSMPYGSPEGEDSYRAEIDWEENTKTPGWENRVKMYEYLIEYGENAEDFRADMAYELPDSLGTDEYEEYLDLIFKEKDWKNILGTMLEKTDDSQKGTKWEYQYRIDNDICPGNTWKDELISTVADIRNSEDLFDENLFDENGGDRQAAKNEEAIALYRLENDLEYANVDSAELSFTGESGNFTMWQAMITAANLVPLVGLLIIVIAGNSVASEFSQGTIKFLLINPVKRWKILMSKYFTVLSVGYIMLAILYVVMIPASGIAVGFDAFSAPFLSCTNGVVTEGSSFLWVAKAYLLNSISIVIMATLAFAVSSLLRSSAFSIGISVFFMLAGTGIAELLANLKMDWARYLVFSNMNLTSIAEGNPMFAHQTLGFAIGVIIAHMAVFILTAWDGFVRREV